MAKNKDMNHTQAIGERLKDLRTEQRLTLQDVQKKTGVAISTLSKIENQQVSASFDTLTRISDGLGVPIETFFTPVPQTLASGRRTITRKEEDEGNFETAQYAYKIHSTELSAKGMVPLEMRVRARSIADFPELNRHRGEEFVYVISGAIEVHTEFYSPFKLKAGESAYFDSSMGHAYISTSKADAHILSICYDPSRRTSAQEMMLTAPARKAPVGETV